jgi:membrane protein
VADSSNPPGREAEDGRPPVVDSDPGSDAGWLARVRAAAGDDGFSEALWDEARDRYEQVAEQWSPRTRRRAVGVVATVSTAIRAAVASRLTGLAAEMSFWGIFALPWVVLGLVAGLASLQSWLGIDVVDQVQQSILNSASRVLNTETVDTVVAPLLDEIFTYGSSGLTLLSFVIALWSGSRLVATAVQAVALVAGETYEGYVRNRARALLIYAVGLVGLLPAVVLLLAGPEVVSGVLGTGGQAIYWVGVLSLTVALLTGLYKYSLQRSPPWRLALPGGVVATVLWGLGSFGLRVYLQVSFRDGSLYGVVGAPIAVLLWAYVTSYAVLLGALVNRMIAERRPR